MKKAVFDNYGFPSAFYETDINDVIPTEAVEITEDQWVELISNNGQRQYVDGQIVEYTPPPPTIEEQREAMPALTARQLRLSLLSLGKLADVDNSLAQLPEPERSQAKIEWEYASSYRRMHPLILQLTPIFGLTDDQVDTIWLQFSTV